MQVARRLDIIESDLLNAINGLRIYLEDMEAAIQAGTWIGRPYGEAHNYAAKIDGLEAAHTALRRQSKQEGDEA